MPCTFEPCAPPTPSPSGRPGRRPELSSADGCRHELAAGQRPGGAGARDRGRDLRRRARTWRSRHPARAQQPRQPAADGLHAPGRLPRIPGRQLRRRRVPVVQRGLLHRMPDLQPHHAQQDIARARPRRRELGPEPLRRAEVRGRPHRADAAAAIPQRQRRQSERPRRLDALPPVASAWPSSHCRSVRRRWRVHDE